MFGLALIRTNKNPSKTMAIGKWMVEYEVAEHSSAKYFVPEYALHRPACRAIVEGRFYEPDTHTLIQELGQQEKGEMVHAGTFFGDMLPSFSSSFAGGRVYCFEPVLENYALARLCVSENNLENMVLFNAALSDTVDNLRIETVGQNGGHRGGASAIGETGIIVPSIMIDQFSFENLICIQLDVEGHELKALSGAKKTIAAHQPIILVEDNQGRCDAFLSELGYSQAGSIPDLNIWVTERRKHLVSDFLSKRV